MVVYAYERVYKWVTSCIYQPKRRIIRLNLRPLFRIFGRAHCVFVFSYWPTMVEPKGSCSRNC